MSRFSEYLKTLVEESGSSVSALARAAGLNRPNLQNVIGGSRKPARGDMEKLLPHLRTSAEQREKLLELLEGELLGEDIVERRAYVQALLERMDQSFRATPVPPSTARWSSCWRGARPGAAPWRCFPDFPQSGCGSACPSCAGWRDRPWRWYSFRSSGRRPRRRPVPPIWICSPWRCPCC